MSCSPIHTAPSTVNTLLLLKLLIMTLSAMNATLYKANSFDVYLEIDLDAGF
jgi:hypothetical protein